MQNFETYKSSDYYHFLTHKKSTDSLLVVFSSIPERPPRFNFFEEAQCKNTHVIFYNAPNVEWYRAGIPGIEGGLSGAVKAIRSFAERCGAKRIHTLGSSKGAYGAALYGSLAKVDSILTFGLEPIVGMPGKLSSKYMFNHLLYAYPDLTTLPMPPLATLHAGMDIQDILGAWIAKKKSGADVFSIPGSNHDAPGHLKEHKALDTTIESFLSEGSKGLARYYAEKETADETFVRFLWSVLTPYVDQDWRQTAYCIEALQGKTFPYPIFYYLLGRVDIGLRYYTRAAKHFLQCLELCPSYLDGWLQLSESYLRTARYENALSAALRALFSKPSSGTAHTQLSRIYARIGDNKSAYDHAEWAWKVNRCKEYEERLRERAKMLGGCVPDLESFPQSSRKCREEANKIFSNSAPSKYKESHEAFVPA